MSTNRQRPQIPQDMKAFNEKLIADFRANHGTLTGPMAGREPLLLTTRGVRTGKQRTVVLGYRKHGDGYAVIASNNGADKAPFWYHNLMAKPTATVEVGAERFEARARVARADERPELAKKIDYYERQQALTEREIPILVLERI